MAAYQQGFNLLIADDHQLIIDGISRILEDQQQVLQIFTATNGEEALNSILQNDIQCVLLDMNMPVMNGYEATKKIRQKKPGTKIIILTMLGDVSVVTRLIRAGADGYVIKNTGKEELLHAIRKVMSGEKYISPELNTQLFTHSIARKTELPGRSLTKREKEIIRFICEGLTNQEIAKNLFLSTSTVDTHRKNILSKLGLHNTAALVRYASENQLV